MNYEKDTDKITKCIIDTASDCNVDVVEMEEFFTDTKHLFLGIYIYASSFKEVEVYEDNLRSNYSDLDISIKAKENIILLAIPVLNKNRFKDVDKKD